MQSNPAWSRAEVHCGSGNGKDDDTFPADRVLVSFRLSADDLGRLVSTLAEMSASLRPPPPSEGSEGMAAADGSGPEPGAAPPVPQVA